MIYEFRDAARIPPGVTAEGVIGERNAIRAKFGDDNPETMARAVIDNPETYPNLRAFGPEDEYSAFLDAIRRGITYAIRSIVVIHDEEFPAPPPVRALVLVTHDDGKQGYESLEVVAGSAKYRNEVMNRLIRDSENYFRRHREMLQELQRLTSLVQG